MAASGIIIRKVIPSDAKGVIESFNEGLQHGFNSYTGSNALRGKKDIAKYRKRYSAKNKDEFTFTAADKCTGKIAGVCNFHGGKRDSRIRHRGEVGWGVHPDYARKGIGTILLRAVLKEARKRGYKKVQAEAAVMNAATVRLDKRRGFRIE